MTMLEMYMRTETKDNFTDFLLSNGYDDFFFMDTKKYAAKHMLQGDEEQVSGRQNYATFRIYLDDDIANALAFSIRKEFKDVKIYALSCQSISS